MAEINSYVPEDPSAAPRALLRTAAPGLYNYFTKPLPPPQIQPNAAGKVPPANYNPNTVPALQDVSNLASMAVPGIGGAGLAAKGATWAAEHMPQAAETVASYTPQMSQAASKAGMGALSSLMGNSPPDLVSPAAAAEHQTLSPNDLRLQLIYLRKQEQERQKSTAAQAQERAASAEQDRLNRAAEAEQARQDEEARAALQLKTSAASAEAQRQQQLQDAAIQEQLKREAAGRPAREQYQNLGALPYVGSAVAAGIPLARNFLAARGINKFAQSWQNAANAGEQALIQGNKPGAQLYGSQLRSFDKQWPGVQATAAAKEAGGLGTYATGALLPPELGIAPEEFDILTQPNDTRAHQQAEDTLYTPSLAGRLALGAAGGIGAAAAGAHVPWATRAPPLGRSQGTATAISKALSNPNFGRKAPPASYTPGS